MSPGTWVTPFCCQSPIAVLRAGTGNPLRGTAAKRSVADVQAGIRQQNAERCVITRYAKHEGQRGVTPMIPGLRVSGQSSYNWRQEVQMKYRIALHKSEEGFSVSVPGLPGCWSQGATEEEALENIRDAIREYLAVVDEQLRGEETREIEVVS